MKRNNGIAILHFAIYNIITIKQCWDGIIYLTYRCCWVENFDN